MATTQPPSPDARTPRSTPGTKGMNPPPVDARAPRKTSGGKAMTPPAAEVPKNQFVDPIPTRPTPAAKPRSVK